MSIHFNKSVEFKQIVVRFANNVRQMIMNTAYRVIYSSRRFASSRESVKLTFTANLKF